MLKLIVICGYMFVAGFSFSAILENIIDTGHSQWPLIGSLLLSILWPLNFLWKGINYLSPRSEEIYEKFRLTIMKD